MRHRINPSKHHILFDTKNELNIEIETDRLKICSIQAKDEKDCIQLFGDAKVMEKFGVGVPYEDQKTRERLATWLQRWKNHDPFGIYAFFDKKANEFVGIIGIGHSAPGESEVIYLIHHRFWGMGYGSEAGDAIFQTLIPNLMRRGYELEYAALKKLVATARLDNPASQNILKSVGFKEEAKIEKFGALRFEYSLFAKQLKNEYEHFYLRLDRNLHKKQQAKIRNTDVDVSDEEMANSAFGRRASL